MYFSVARSHLYNYKFYMRLLIAGNSNNVNEVKEKVSTNETSMCNVCGIPISNANMQMHIAGKKHQNHLKKIGEVTRRNRNAIKVTGECRSIIPIIIIIMLMP